MVLVNALRHFITVHSWHAPVHQHQVVWLSCISQFCNRRRAIPGRAHLQVEKAQHFRQDFPRNLVVVHHQHPNAAQQRARLLQQLHLTQLRLLSLLQPDGEAHGRAAPRGGFFHPDAPAHHLHQVTAYSQPQPRAAKTARGGLVGLGELLEQVALHLGRHANARVAHAHLHGNALCRGLHVAKRKFHFTTLGELHGVTAQVEQHLPQPQWVTHQAWRNRRVIAYEEFNPFGLGLVTHGVGQLLQHRIQTKLYVLNVEFACLDFGKIKNVVDDAQQRAGSALSFRQLVAQRCVQLSLERQVEHAQDGIHRRAYLVAHDGQEITLHARQVFGLFLGLAQFRRAL